MQHTYTAFLEGRRLATGPLHGVAVAVLRAQQAQAGAYPLVFNDASGRSADIDLRGGEEAVAARYTVPVPTEAPKGRGRPKLGVVAREITLLPRHWDWLAQQKGGASVVIRRLVDEARRNGDDDNRVRLAQEAAYRFMSVMAGNRPHYEEAIRALFANDAPRLATLIAEWPADVRDHVARLAKSAFPQEN